MRVQVKAFHLGQTIKVDWTVSPKNLDHIVGGPKAFVVSFLVKFFQTIKFLSS